MNSIFQQTILTTIIFNIILLYSCNCEKDEVLICKKNKIIFKSEASYFGSKSEKTISSNIANNVVNAEKLKTVIQGQNINEKMIQLGIQETINLFDSKVENDTPIFLKKKSEFVDVLKFNNDFVFRAFVPENFLNLRKLYGISKEFNQSFKSSTIIDAKNIGNYRPKFYFTNDYKFIIDIVSKEEQQSLISIISKYFSYFCSSQNNFLPRISGLFYIKHNNVEYYLITRMSIYSNLLVKNVNKVYYVKGKDVKALSNIAHLKDDKKITLFENNLSQDFKNGLQIPSNLFNDLRDMIKSDCQFLKELNMTNYILFLVIFPQNKIKANMGSNVSNVINSMKLQTTRNYNVEKRRITVTYDGQTYSAYLGIINVLQKGNLQCKGESNKNRNNLISNLLDPSKYSKQFVEYFTGEVFKSGGTD